MDEQLKRRLIGVAALASLAVIFLPMLMDRGTQPEAPLASTQIPARRSDQPRFESRVLPEPGAQLAPPVQPITPPTSFVAPGEAPPSTPQTPATASPRASKPEPAAPIATTPAAPTTPAPKVAAAAPAPKIPTAAAAPKTPAPTQTAKAPSAPRPMVGVPAWVVQVASLATQAKAEQRAAELRAKGFTSFVEPTQANGKTLYRIRVGPEADRKRAEDTLAEIKKVFKDWGQGANVVRYP